MSMRQKIVVVLGMHRSGTSALTKSLELLGINQGSNLHPAAEDNPKGFWEDRECIAINEAVLQHCNSAYDHLLMATEDIPDDTIVNALQSRAAEYISARLAENNGIWGFKDPRTCRLLSFWKVVFEKIGCEVNFIIAVRNPASVAASLARRNDIPVEKSYFLWLEHTLPALLLTTGYPRVVVEYDNFLTNAYSQLVRVAHKLNLPLVDNNDPLFVDFEKEFLSESLRHHKFSEADLTLHNGAIPLVRESYTLLMDLAVDKCSLESAEVMSTINSSYQRLLTYRPALKLANFYEIHVSQLNVQINEKNKTLEIQLARIRSSKAWKIREAVINFRAYLAGLLPPRLRSLRSRDARSARNKSR